MSGKLHRQGISFMNTDTRLHYSVTKNFFVLGSSVLWCGGRPVHCMQNESSTCLKFFKPQTASGTSLQLVSLYQSLVINLLFVCGSSLPCVNYTFLANGLFSKDTSVCAYCEESVDI